MNPYYFGLNAHVLMLKIGVKEKILCEVLTFDWVCSFITRHGGVCLSVVVAYIHFERHVLFKNDMKIQAFIRARKKELSDLQSHR